MDSRMRKGLRMLGVVVILVLLAMTSIGSRGCFSSSSTKRAVGSSAPPPPVFYVFGGWDNESGNLDEIVEFDLSSPITVTVISNTIPAAFLPTTRFDTSAVWDPVNKVAYIFGGNDGAFLDDIVRFEPTSITPVTVLSITINSDFVLPSARKVTSAVWDPDNKVAYIFGGYNGALLDEIVRFEPASITPVTIVASLPTTRQATSAVWDPVNKVAYIFGGYGANEIDEIVRFEPASITPVTVISETSGSDFVLPSARQATSAVWDPVNKVAYIFGGWDGANEIDDIVKFDPAIPEVTVLSVTMGSTIVLPTERGYFSACPGQ